MASLQQEAVTAPVIESPKPGLHMEEDMSCLLHKH